MSFVPPIKLLVVEDHLALLDVTVEILAAQGHEVIGISSAESLHELPAHFVADIALLDLNLPGEVGLSLARRLRQLQPRIGIIMLTARNGLQEKLASYKHGADVYLTKPIESQELCATVQAMAQRLRRSVAPAPHVFIFDSKNRRLKPPQGELLLRPAESVFCTLWRSCQSKPCPLGRRLKRLKRLKNPWTTTAKHSSKCWFHACAASRLPMAHPPCPSAPCAAKATNSACPCRWSNTRPNNGFNTRFNTRAQAPLSPPAGAPPWQALARFLQTISLS